MNPIFSKIEFEALLLIYAANIDYEFHVSEKKLIIKVYGQQTFDKMDLFYQKSKPDAFDFILKNFRLMYPKEEEKIQLKEKLMKLFLVDLDYSVFEKGFIKFYDQLCLH